MLNEETSVPHSKKNDIKFWEKYSKTPIEQLEAKELGVRNAKVKKDISSWWEILMHYRNIKNLLDYDNEMWKEEGLLADEENWILMMHSNPVKAWQRYGDVV